MLLYMVSLHMLADGFLVFLAFLPSSFLTVLTELLDTFLVTQSTGRDVPSPSFSVERAGGSIQNLSDSINCYFSSACHNQIKHDRI